MRRAAGLCLFTCLALAAAGPARAARLPDWAREIADAAPPLTEGVSERAARVLLLDNAVTIQPDGTMRQRLRLAKQALSARADDENVGLGAFPFRDGAKIRRSKAWHLAPGERAEKSGRLDEFDITDTGAFLTDARARVVHVGGLRRGSLVFFEFDVEERPVALEILAYVSREEDVSRARVSVELPPAWSLTSAWMRHDGPPPAVAGTTYNWELRDLAAIDDSEDFPVPRDEREPMLVIALRPPAGLAKPASFDSWPAVARWWDAVAAERAKVTPEIAAAAAALGPADAPPLERIVRTARHVRDGVRYVARAIGEGGYRPRPAPETLVALLGDCKDKATLLRALLAAQSVPSFTLLVPFLVPGNATPDVPVLGAFDHVIVAVPLPDGVTPPGDALLDLGPSGRLLLIDPTADAVSPGSLPWQLYGKTGLLAAGEGSRLVQLPDARADAHGLVVRIETDIAAGGAVAYRIERTYRGVPAALTREDWRASRREQQESLNQWLARRFGSVAGTTVDVEEETAEGALVERLAFQVAPGPPVKIEWFPGALELLPRTGLARRKTDVRFRYPRTMRAEQVIRGWPSSVALPAARESRGERWSLTTRFEQRAEGVHATFDLALESRTFPVSAIPELKKLYSAAANAAESTFTLSP